MDLIAWTPDLSVNNEKIDEQHQELFKRFNQVGEAIWDGKGRDEIGTMIGFMSEYVDKHFGDEEALMTAHNYPGYGAQKAAHDDFVRQVAEMRAKFDSGEVTSEFVVEVVTKLGDWFKNHIRKLDTELGSYIAERSS